MAVGGLLKKMHEDPTVEEIKSISDLLTKAINEIDDDYGYAWKQSDTFAPSGSNQCARYAAYRLRGFEQKFSWPGRMKRLFDLGNLIEIQVEKIFTRMDILVDKQIEIFVDNPPIRGYLDFVIEFGGKKYIVECKSANDMAYSWRQKLKKPKDDHMRQIQIYLEAMDMEEGFLLYYGKNDSDILLIHVKRDRDFIKKLFKKYDKIYKVYNAGNIPARPYKQTSPSCAKCDAFDYCWADKEVGVPL